MTTNLTIVQDLVTRIKKYSQSYYSGESEVSDEYWDSLVDQLRFYDPDNDLLKKIGWGFEINGDKVKHSYNLTVGSLSKILADRDTIPNNFCDTRVRISAKLDGLTVVSYYKNGDLVLALTRGNGTYGQDVTDKMRIIGYEKLPNQFSGAIRGEVLISNDDWTLYNLNTIFSNQRNAASGIMNRDDWTPSDLLGLSYVVYKIIAWEKDDQSYEIERISEFLEDDLAFKHAPYVYTSDVNSCNLRELYDKYNSIYPCDGLVFTLGYIPSKDDILEYTEIAYKFQAESKESKVTGIDWNTTITGKVVPVVQINPVELSGAMVCRVTAYNAKFVKDNKIGVGSLIECCRSGEVIPKILKVNTPAQSVEMISKCPQCGGDLHWKGVDLVCDNCSESNTVYQFISTIAEMDNVGGSLYTKLINIFNLDSIESLVNFLKELNYDGDYELFLNKACKEISGTVTQSKVREILDTFLKPINPVRFLVACNIPGLSWTTAKAILDYFPNFSNDPAGDDLDRLYEIKGIGGSLVESIRKNMNRLIALRKYVIISTHTKEEQPQFKVAITGSLSIKRSEFDKKLADKGISQSGNFKEIKYLITNNPNSTSSKMQNAKKNGVEIISEDEFTRLYL